MKNIKKIHMKIVFTCVVTMIITSISYITGARINITKSLPIGLYWTTDKPIEKGSYVLFCPPNINIFRIAKDRNYITGGFCPGNYGYMIKKILAAKGDRVTITDKGVFVNENILPHSKPIKTDLAGRDLPHYKLNQYTLNNSELLLMSDVSDISFDSRYFGPVNCSQVKSVIYPIITW